ncbi:MULTISPECIES: sensor histidine kinase [Rhodococcus erythropolis group]|jgi:signal transduction histidine kinase|uniref:histidine kinase n=2 Tax=Rhodococcus erythropolis group TaxID=2840174 RepID=A0A6G9D229_RHOER|nr:MULTISPECIES: ATP-binding protein [Rhodococcus erythropolis group]MCT6735611.1 histidine kinase [Rhodococcus qingshengii]MDJ0433970.1 histidine kinase [Rhodococcus qingshengii]QIP43287.1 histidine kinase [Rhodococcus erythropolis]
MTSSVPLRGRLVTSVLRPSAPPLSWGIALATGLIVVEILLVLMLKRIAPENAFGAVFLFGVLVVSAGWGFRLSIATAVASTAAYAYIHVVESRESLVPAVVVFLVLALLTNVLVGQSRLRAMESDQRRREADLLAALARTMLRTSNVVEMLDDASVRLSAVLDLPAPYAKLGPADAPVGRGQRRIVLRDGACVAGSLLVPAELTQADARRVQRIVPSLEALLAAVRDRGVLLEQTLALARQQASLRRVATLVASRAEPDDVHHAVAAELADGLDIEHVSVVRYDDDDYFTILAARDDTTTGERLIPGERFPVGGYNVCTIVETSGAPIAIDFTTATGAIAGRLRGRGLRTGIGVPINVDGRTWGAVIIGGTGRVLASDVEDRLTDFADLLATAVYNGETRRELTRSRARVVAAADKARRTIERDLHDGAQQRIVTLGMELRGAQAAVPDGFDELRISLARTVETLAQVNTDLRELSRGIHPAILSRGGLAPALKTLARRSPIPVALTAEIVTRLTDSVEVAAYYVVAEALTNTAKYADASVVTIAAVSQEGRLDLTISDDGKGGADAESGSGLIGLQDRVAAVGGTLTISSPVGGGTTITVRIDPSTS